MVFWFALSLGLWRVAPCWRYYGMPGLPDLGEILQVRMLASLGAGVGGLFKRMRIGAAIGACLMACGIVLLWAIQRTSEWLTPI
jgi:hypothetical protein